VFKVDDHHPSESIRIGGQDLQEWWERRGKGGEIRGNWVGGDRRNFSILPDLGFTDMATGVGKTVLARVLSFFCSCFQRVGRGGLVKKRRGGNYRCI